MKTVQQILADILDDPQVQAMGQAIFLELLGELKTYLGGASANEVGAHDLKARFLAK